MRGVKIGHLWIQECGIKDCKSNGRWHYHRPNPKGQAIKSMEMTVRRALALYAAFEELDQEHQDWTDLNLKTWREVFGRVDPRGRELPELWERYKAGTLADQIIQLADNLVLDDVSKEARKEIQDGLRRISKG